MEIPALPGPRGTGSAPLSKSEQLRFFPFILMFYTFNLFEEQLPMFKMFKRRNPGPNDFWNANTRQVHSSLGMAFAASHLAGLPQALENTHRERRREGRGSSSFWMPWAFLCTHQEEQAHGRAASQRGALSVKACRDWPHACAFRSRGSPPRAPGAGCASAAR